MAHGTILSQVNSRLHLEDVIDGHHIGGCPDNETKPVILPRERAHMGWRKRHKARKRLASLQPGRFHGSTCPNNNQSYGSLVRRTILFQLRLMADGLRDLLLSPIAVIAALLGLLRPDNPSWALDRLMMMGRLSDRWINLFEQEDCKPSYERSDTLDDFIDHVEREVKSRLDPDTPPEDASWARSFSAALNRKQADQSGT